MRNAYDILGITHSSTKETIKKAYRELCKKYHPDRGGNEEKFKEISKAYKDIIDGRVKVDPKSRVEEKWKDNRDWEAFKNTVFNGTKDFFNKILLPKQVIKYDLGMKDLFQEIKLKYTRNIKCESCYGSGGNTIMCKTCKGLGSFNERIKTVFGDLETRKTCTDCNGRGSNISNYCEGCDGEGYNSRTIILKISINIDSSNCSLNRDEYSIIFREQGNWTPGRGYGDLILKGKFKDFEIVNNYIVYQPRISIAEAALGCELTIGAVVIDIKEGGEAKLISEYNGYHKVLIKPEVIIPKKLTNRENELLNEIFDNELLKGE